MPTTAAPTISAAPTLSPTLSSVPTSKPSAVPTADPTGAPTVAPTMDWTTFCETKNTRAGGEQDEGDPEPPLHRRGARGPQDRWPPRAQQLLVRGGRAPPLVRGDHD